MKKEIQTYINQLDIKPKSAKQYAWALNHFFDYLGYYVPSPVIAKEYKYILIDSDMSLFTISNILTVLKGFYRYLCIKNHETINIFANIKIPSPTKEFVKGVLSKVELQKLINNLKSDQTIFGKRNYLIILLMVYNGLRASEVISINRNDIFVDENLKSKLKILGKARLKRQSIVIDSADYLLIEEYKAEVMSKDGSLFTSLGIRNNLNRISYAQVYNIVINSFFEIGLYPPKYTPHSLRHTAAYFMYLATKDITKIKAFLRHSDIKTTQLYMKAIENFHQNVGEPEKNLRDFLNLEL